MTTDTRTATSYAAQAVAGLHRLAQVLDLPPEFSPAAEEAIQTLFAGWGHRTSRAPGDTSAPFEYSLVLSGDRTDVRLFYRPLATTGPTTALASWDQGLAVLAELERRGVVSLARERQLGELFRPRAERTAFGMCLAVSVTPTGIDRVKVYHDTYAAGPQHHQALLGEALTRLGHGKAWAWVRHHDPAGFAALMPAVLALDLQDETDARVKFYTTVHERSVAELRERARVLSEGAGRAAGEFVEEMAVAGSAALSSEGVRPTLCWSITSPDRPTDATLYLPSNRYAPGRGEIVERLRKRLPGGALRRVKGLIGERNPFHWVGTKLVGGEGSLTLYLSAAEVEAARVAG